MTRISHLTRHAAAGFLLALLLMPAATLAMRAEAPLRATSAPSAQSARRAPPAVMGSVFDSLASTPLVGARVQLVGAEPSNSFSGTAITDSSGRFLIDSVVPGVYMIGFLHPVLDSLGLESPVRSLRVSNEGITTVSLAIPSAERVRAAVCAGTTQGGALIGFVRDIRSSRRTEPITVTAEWMEVQIGREGLQRRAPRRNTQTRDGGWFALCGVPSLGSMFVYAHQGADTTAIVPVEVPAAGVLRQELFLGDARVVMDTVARSGDSSVVRRRFVGNGQLSGVILTRVGGQPLANAQVGIVDGPQARTNDRGEFTLSGIAEGTRALEVRAVGYYPERRSVNVRPNSAAMRVTLATLQSVLDTMRIRATRTRVDNLRGFRERMATGQGRYLTPEMIERRMPQFTADIFRNQGGVLLQDDSLRVRSIGGYGESTCVPTFYLDAMPMRQLSVSELNLLVNPREIRGIEIYAATQVPSIFSDGMTGCGVIAIWTR